MEAVHVPAQSVPPESPQAKQLCHLHVQLSWGQSCYKQKKKKKNLHICTQDRFSNVHSLRPCRLWRASLLRQGRSPGKNTGVYIGQYCLPFWSTIVPVAQAASSSEYLVLPEPLRPKQLHHLHTWPSQGQAQVLLGSLRSNPQGMTHRQRWK